MTNWIYRLTLLIALLAASAWAAENGNSVVVVYNKNLPASKELAEHYAKLRSVPSGQLFGVDVDANSESLSRAEFRDKMETPIFKWLVKEKLFIRNPKKRSAKDTDYHVLTESKVRYLVLCYGVPLKISADASLKEDGMDKVQEILRGRNDAAVDADLALLPSSQEKIALTGPLGNPFYLTTNEVALHPTNGIIMITRLDGPTVEIARGLVDKALEAEVNGLWGRAYVDARGITNGEYKLGDDWMRISASILRRMGFETYLDDQEPTLGAGFPMSQIAIYAGWYNQDVSGPLARPNVEFMPGAFAYHLFSVSAGTLRSTTRFWVGPLLAKGATITMGCVEEPYLAGTPNVAAFLDRLIYRHWSFGEAAYASQASLSWQTTVVGDPLYRPFATPPDALHFKLEREHSPLIEWSHLRVVDLNEATGLPRKDLIKYIQDIPAVATNSAVLQEKLGQLFLLENQLELATEAMTRAVKLKPSLQQRIRILTVLERLHSAAGHNKEALDACKELMAAEPDYPDAARVYDTMSGLAAKMDLKTEGENYRKIAEKLRGLNQGKN